MTFPTTPTELGESDPSRCARRRRPGRNRHRRATLVALGVVLALLATACTEDKDSADGGDGGAPATDGPAPADVEAAGLWDDGPCDAAGDPLQVGLMSTFASPVISAEDQALALEAAAVAFNERGGANGHCIEVTTCDEKADPNTALDCVRGFDEAGVAVSINDTTASTPGPEVGEAYAEAGIARFAINAATPDLTDPNAYPIDAGGIGTAMVMPQALIDRDITEIATIRVDLPAASAIIGLFEDVYGDDGAEFVADIPVPAGTTDYSQFILSAEDAGAEGVLLPLGGQEAIQVLRAAQQLGSELTFSTSLGTLPYADMAELGDFAEQVVLNGSTPPATTDLPAMDVLVADLAASGEEVLQPTELKGTATRSWIGLYALLTILRGADTDDFSRENITALIDESGPIDMLGFTSDWTPNTDNPGAFPRTGNGHYGFWEWDPDGSYDGEQGNFTAAGETDFTDLLCGSPLGAPADSC